MGSISTGGNSIFTSFPAGKFLTDTSFPSYEVISKFWIFLTGNSNSFPSESVYISEGIVLEDVAIQFTLSPEVPEAIYAIVSG